MADPSSAVFGERSLSKVAAVFANHDSAVASAREVQQRLQLLDGQVQVVRPGDPRSGRKMQPESAGIARTLVRTHVVGAVAGLIVGLLAFAILWAAGVQMIVNSPVMAAVTLAVFGIVAGMMAGGFVALRPDQDAYILAVEDAISEGGSAVVVHAGSEEQKQQAREVLEQHSGEVIATL